MMARSGGAPSSRTCADLVQLNAPADLDHSVVERMRADPRPLPLMDLEWAPQNRAETGRGGAGGLVLDDADLAREHALADHATLLVEPRPHPDQGPLAGRSLKAVDLVGRVHLDELPLRTPLRAARDEGQLAVEAHRDLARGGA